MSVVLLRSGRQIDKLRTTAYFDHRRTEPSLRGRTPPGGFSSERGAPFSLSILLPGFCRAVVPSAGSCVRPWRGCYGLLTRAFGLELSAARGRSSLAWQVEESAHAVLDGACEHADAQARCLVPLTRSDALVVGGTSPAAVRWPDGLSQRPSGARGR